MHFAEGQTKQPESAISILLLAVLLVIAAGVFLKQSNVQMSRFGIDTKSIEQGAPKSEKTIKEITVLNSLEAGDFETSGKTEIYDSENLYEKINGKAPFYIEAGFVKLFTKRFISQTDDRLGMELYLFDMGDLKNAFSVYSSQKRADAEDLSATRLADLPVQPFTYRTSNGLYLVRGKYYMELVGFSESDKLAEILRTLAQKLTDNLDYDKTAQIAELDLFPQQNLIDGSFKLYLSNAFGFASLTDTFTAQYKFADQTITAFFSKRKNYADARNLTESYYKFLIENEAQDKRVSSENLKYIYCKIVDFYGTIEIVLVSGRFVIGIHEADEQAAAEKLAEILVNKLEKIK